jgi:hypothetical protein
MLASQKNVPVFFKNAKLEFFGSGASLVKYIFWHLELFCAADNNKISPNLCPQQPTVLHRIQRKKKGCKICVVKGWVRAGWGGGGVYKAQRPNS